MKTTRKQFEIFSAECRRLWELWGMQGWNLVLYHRPLDDNLGGYCEANASQRTVWISLATDWEGDPQPTPAVLRRYARHEVIHALLQPLAAYAGWRYASAVQLDEAEHEVLRRLERLLP